jgi:hypothetical protein
LLKYIIKLFMFVGKYFRMMVEALGIIPPLPKGRNMSNYEKHLAESMRKLPEYVQPRYKQDRTEVVSQLLSRLATNRGSFPQLVDPSIVEVGDELTIVRAIETKPLWKATITRITPLLCQGAPDVMLNMTTPERIEISGTDPLPTQRTASSLGFAELSSGGLDLPDDYFSYTHVFLSGIEMPLETEPRPAPAQEAPRVGSTLPDGWWAWDV